MISLTVKMCEHVYLPNKIDMQSLQFFIKVNQKKVIIINYSYFSKWDAKTKKILYYLLYMNKKGKIENPIWMLIDTNDLDKHK